LSFEELFGASKPKEAIMLTIGFSKYCKTRNADNACQKYQCFKHLESWEIAKSEN
jgi:hypothetical protein